MVKEESLNQVFSEEQYLKEIHRLQKTIHLYEQVGEKVRNATVMDLSIYTGEQESDWLSIDREDYVKIMDALSKIDLWKPWQHSIQPRLTK